MQRKPLAHKDRTTRADKHWDLSQVNDSEINESTFESRTHCGGRINGQTESELQHTFRSRGHLLVSIGGDEADG